LDIKPIFSNSLFIGKVAIYKTSLDSTNTQAKLLLSKSNPIEGTAIYAGYQTAGKGQFGSSWQSVPNENILLSIILYPKFLLVEQQFRLHQVVSLAVYDLLSTYLQPVDALKIKWPNDIYYQHQKLGGILIENELKGAYLDSAVIGLGLNVNQTVFPASLQRATSLKLQTGNTYDVVDLMGEFCWYLEQRYLQLRGQQYKILETEYLQLLYGYQEWRSFQEAESGKRFGGKIIGLNAKGLLQVQAASSIQTYNLKELIFEFEQ
jgi:BirA family biotin operon repressor/biotin-[acetyl-CoA-carboxylase] ligase